MDPNAIAAVATPVVVNAWHPILTWNLFLTAIIVPGVGWLIAVYMKRAIKNSDELKLVQHQLLLKSIEKTDALNLESHKTMNESLNTWCALSTKEHEEIWRHHFHHNHNDKGQVTYTGKE